MTLRKFFWIAVLLFLCYIVYAVVKLSQSVAENDGFSTEIDKELLPLFNTEITGQFSNKITVYNKVRNPVSIFEYSAYTIWVSKIEGIQNEFKLKPANFENKELITAAQAFKQYKRHNFNLQYHSGSPAFDGNLYITMSAGMLERVVENDSLEIYYIKSGQSAFSFDENSPNDFLIEARPSNADVSYLLNVVKKGTSLYLFEVVLNGSGEIGDKKIIETLLK